MKYVKNENMQEEIKEFKAEFAENEGKASNLQQEQSKIKAKQEELSRSWRELEVYIGSVDNFLNLMWGGAEKFRDSAREIELGRSSSNWFIILH